MVNEKKSVPTKVIPVKSVDRRRTIVTEAIRNNSSSSNVHLHFDDNSEVIDEVSVNDSISDNIPVLNEIDVEDGPKAQDFLMSRSVFSDVCDDIVKGINNDFSITDFGTNLLQFCTEDYLTNAFQSANQLVEHRNQVIVKKEDLAMAVSSMKLQRPFSYMFAGSFTLALVSSSISSSSSTSIISLAS
jgi:histone H3/H4